MQIAEDKIEHLDEQSELLLRKYQLELAKDPSSHAIASPQQYDCFAAHHRPDLRKGDFVDPVVSDRSATLTAILRGACACPHPGNFR
jgi:hypothetical protein